MGFLNYVLYTQLNFVNFSYYFLNPLFLEECFVSVCFSYLSQYGVPYFES